jgi:hypothetical protein
MQRDNKKKIFLKDNRGFIELYFTPNEVLSMLEILAFTRRLCNSLMSQENSPVSEDIKILLQEKQLAASLLEEKIKMDADPGKPEGPLH